MSKSNVIFTRVLAFKIQFDDIKHSPNTLQANRQTFEQSMREMLMIFFYKQISQKYSGRNGEYCNGKAVNIHNLNYQRQPLFFFNRRLFSQPNSIFQDRGHDTPWSLIKFISNLEPALFEVWPEEMHTIKRLKNPLVPEVKTARSCNRSIVLTRARQLGKTPSTEKTGIFARRVQRKRGHAVPRLNRIQYSVSSPGYTLHLLVAYKNANSEIKSTALIVGYVNTWRHCPQAYHINNTTII